MTTENNSTNKEINKDKIKERLQNDSFKIKPILLELPNYEYFHTSIIDKDDDTNQRFVGRTKIINKILSFIHETSKNTGTYLVTGYRGMGKTSVVNKALSTLNPIKKTKTFYLLWLALLPWVIFSKTIFINIDAYEITYLFILIPIGIITLILFTFYFLGKINPLIDKKSDNKHRIIKIVIQGAIVIANPKLNKSKYSFESNLRSFAIYIIALILFLSCLILGGNKCEKHFISHKMFWLITYSIPISYMLLKIYTLLIKKFKIDKNDKKIISKKILYTLLIATIFLTVIYLYSYFYKSSQYFLYVFMFYVFFILGYFNVKNKLEDNEKKKTKNIYKSTFSHIKSFLNFQQFIVVRVNLGKDNLTEKDVLKYITNELYKEYNHWYSNLKNAKRIINKLGLLFMLYLSCSAFYIGFLSTEFSHFSSRTMDVAVYFPSQALLTEDTITSNHIMNLLYEDEDYTKTRTLDQYIDKIKGLKKGSKLHIGYDQYHNVRSNSFWPHISNNIKLVCNELDYLSIKLWIKTKQLLLARKIENGESKNRSDNTKNSSTGGAKAQSTFTNCVNLIYPNVPILFVNIFIGVFLLITRYFNFNRPILKTHFHTLRKLKRIRAQIDASITFEAGANANVSQAPLSFYRKKQTSYRPLEAKDITQKLIHFLDEVENLRFIFTKVKFIFVFDELDKINPHNAVVLSSREDEFESDNQEVRYQARRKERIALILASMKHFLNSAKAKFIFIAGREMYDASLAGISDRESSLDSIFNNNKLYINSFYTEEDENGNSSDITSITEQYLCQFLIPEWYLDSQNQNPNLYLYNKYLKEVFYMNKADGADKFREERNKIISTLKDYVVYLAYRSNGAPRMLSNLIEQNVIPVCQNELSNNKSYVVGGNNQSLYIRIGFHDQYKFSLISSLTTPIFLSIGNFLQEYSDKLLVSISYMLDHLYKFHKFGISHRNLSLTPEIVDVNKEPQFREFLNKLLHTLSKSHLRPIVSGIYDYKFHSKISSEIKFLSKIDEQEAAALNFTLDESIELKRFFNKRLELLKTKETALVTNYEGIHTGVHINNIGLLHMTIGDLHFYDEEYQDAITHYMDAIQNLKQKNIQDMVLYDFVLFVRNKLKLALAFEKNQIYDNAFMTYSELTDLIIRKRNIPMRKFGLAKFVIPKEKITNNNELDPFTGKSISNRNHMNESIKKFFDDEKNKSKDIQDIVVLGRLKSSLLTDIDFSNIDKIDHYWKTVHSIDHMETFYGMDSTDLIANISKIDTNYYPLKFFFSKSTGENIRILYQPIIAKLHIIEKSSPDQLKDIDIIRAIKEFNFIRLPLRTEKKRVIITEFYNKIGDLLYFKNGTLNKGLKTMLLSELENSSQKEASAIKNLLLSPIDATIFYVKSLATLLAPVDQNIIDSNPENARTDILEYYEKEHISVYDRSKFLEDYFKELKGRYQLIRSKLKNFTEGDNLKERHPYDYLMSVANGTTDLAESISSFVSDSYTIKNYPNSNIDDIISHMSFDLQEIIELYYYAYEIYFSIGSYRLAKSQLLKILHVLREATAKTEGISNNSNVLKEERNGEYKVFGTFSFYKDIIQPAVTCIYHTYDLSHLIEEIKIEEIFKGSTDDQKLNKISKSAVVNEINEIILLGWRLELNYLGPSDYQSVIKFYNKFNLYINPKSTIRRKLNRLLELRIKLKVNKLIYTESEKESEKIKELYQQKQFNNLEEFQVFLIIDSIGANYELLKTHYLFDIDYVTTNHNQLAKAHYSMAYWSKEFNKFNKENDKYKELVEETVLNSKTQMYINPKYHLKQALEYNLKTKNFHSRGEPLKAFLKPATYLDDFYNDNIIHFSIAVERNTVHERDKGVDLYIENIKKEISCYEDGKESNPENRFNDVSLKDFWTFLK